MFFFLLVPKKLAKGKVDVYLLAALKAVKLAILTLAAFQPLLSSIHSHMFHNKGNESSFQSVDLVSLAYQCTTYRSF